MSFDPNARLDPGQVEDARGGGLGGRGMLIGGGGIGTVLILVIYLLAGGNLGDLGVSQQPSSGAPPTSLQECNRGSDANQREDCRLVGYVNSIQKFWTDEFKQEGKQYDPAKTVLYTDQVSTGCGVASSSVGPFYCPEDKQVYIDLGFFNQLTTQLGARGGSLAEGYVVAHEYGHHIQDEFGTLSSGSGQQGATGRSVRTELQADCFAGVWANHAASTGFLEPLTQQEIGDALDAAASVGDDRIQKKTQGQIDPDTWTHGSAAQRQKWFTIGYTKGTRQDCDTFSGSL